MAADYNAAVYRAQGGNELVVASTTSGASTPGKITVEPGSYGVVQSVQTLGTSQTATNITGSGLTALVPSTTGPTYTIPAPGRAGIVKYIALQTATSAASNAVIAAATTDVVVGITGDNQITLTSTGTAMGVTLVSESTGIWRVVAGQGAAASAVSAAQST